MSLPPLAGRSTFYKVFLVSSSSGVSVSDSYSGATAMENYCSEIGQLTPRQPSYAIKTVAQGTQSSPLCRKWVALTLYDIRMDNWLPCTEKIYQRKARIFPGIGLWCSSSSSNVIFNRINCLNCFQSYNNICYKEMTILRRK